MKILIIGANGYLGARLYLELKKKHEVIGTYFSNKLSNDLISLDITNKEQVLKLLNQIKPNIIIHAANNASSKWCEENPEKAILLNQTATKYIVDGANINNSKLIYISSLAAVSPINLYGKTKFESEKIVETIKTKYLIFRPSLILGFSPNTTNDRPFNRILKNIDEKTPAIYENAWNFQPTYIRNISEVISGCINKNIWNQTIPIIVPEMTTRYDSATDILAPFGINVQKEETSRPYFKDFEMNTDLLIKLGLPTYSYKQMIQEIIEEIRNRDKFKL